MNNNLRSRILVDVINSSTAPVENSSNIGNVNSDLTLIFTILLCTLICVLSLVAIARCAWLWRISAQTTNSPQNKALKKEVFNSLPKVVYTADEAGKFSDCAICLTEFVVGDEIRVLPSCGHGFHVGCIDMWLGSHSLCPTCRQFPVAAPRCHACRGSVAGAETGATRLGQHTEDHVIIRFLP